MLWCLIILFNMHLFIVKLGKISFLFIICYWFYIPVNKDYQNGKAAPFSCVCSTSVIRLICISPAHHNRERVPHWWFRFRLISFADCIRCIVIICFSKPAVAEMVSIGLQTTNRKWSVAYWTTSLPMMTSNDPDSAVFYWRTRNVGQCPTWWPPCRI